MYHSIDTHGTALSVHPDIFERQVRLLADEGWSPIRLSEAAHILNQGNSIPTRSVVLTFDDAMPSVLDIATPILQKYNFHATTFVVTGQVGECPEWYRLHPIYKKDPLLDRSGLDQLAEAGWEIQPHTQDHPVLAHLPLSQQLTQICESRDRIREWFGTEGDVLAYPFGQYNHETVEAMQQAEMSAGVSLQFSAYLTSAQPFDWPRIGSAWFKDSALRQRLALAGYLEWYVALKHRLKGDRSRHFLSPSMETTRGLLGELDAD